MEKYELVYINGSFQVRISLPDYAIQMGPDVRLISMWPDERARLCGAREQYWLVSSTRQAPRWRYLLSSLVHWRGEILQPITMAEALREACDLADKGANIHKSFVTESTEATAASKGEVDWLRYREEAIRELG
jgi:hypothetical protein